MAGRKVCEGEASPKFPAELADLRLELGVRGVTGNRLVRAPPPPGLPERPFYLLGKVNFTL